MTEKKYVELDTVIEAFDNPAVERNYGDVDPDSVIRIIEAIPAANVQSVVTCGECMYAPSGDGQGFDLEWPHDNWPENNPCPCKCEDGWYSYKPRPSFFCANGKREE